MKLPQRTGGIQKIRFVPRDLGVSSNTLLVVSKAYPRQVRCLNGQHNSLFNAIRRAKELRPFIAADVGPLPQWGLAATARKEKQPDYVLRAIFIQPRFGTVRPIASSFKVLIDRAAASTN